MPKLSKLPTIKDVNHFIKKVSISGCFKAN